jgi:hypothetical protein
VPFANRAAYFSRLDDRRREIGIPLNPPVDRLSADSQREGDLFEGHPFKDQSKNHPGANVEGHGVKLPEIVCLSSFRAIARGERQPGRFWVIHCPWE